MLHFILFFLSFNIPYRALSALGPGINGANALKWEGAGSTYAVLASWPELGGQAGGALWLDHAPRARSQFRWPQRRVLFRRPHR